VNKINLAAILILISMIFITFASADDDPEITKLKNLCKESNATACFKLGEKYRIIYQDNKTALRFYKKACDGDYMTACTNGGNLLFMKGRSEWKEAKKTYQKACDAGEDPACFNLGSINYREGRQKKAIKFYSQACKMGNKPGCAKEKRLQR
jgi:uncharacterized protein